MEAWCMLGRALLEAGHSQRAVEVLRSATERNPQRMEPRAAFQLAVRVAACGDSGEALLNTGIDLRKRNRPQ